MYIKKNILSFHTTELNQFLNLSWVIKPHKGNYSTNYKQVSRFDGLCLFKPLYKVNKNVDRAYIHRCTASPAQVCLTLTSDFSSMRFISRLIEIKTI